MKSENMSSFSELDSFQPISLTEMDTVRMMNRIDTKYVLNRIMLLKVLETIKDNYRVLEMKQKRVFPYSSLYFDTINRCMYLSHHNGKLNRYKIRMRKYIQSNDTFLEIKFKHKGMRTIKKRTSIDDIETILSEFSGNYIEEITPFYAHTLEPVMYTNFSRITLVNNNFSERVTIDYDLNFKQDGRLLELGDICIIETKRDGAANNSLLYDTLMNHGIHAKGMSKYCIGLAMIDPKIKKNNFKERILMINKIKNGKQYYRNVTT